MKWLRTLLLLILVPTLANAQWFRTRENAATQRTIFYRYWPGILTSDLPTYWDFPDTGKTWILYNDTIVMPKFIDKNNNPGATTVLSINSIGWVTGTSTTNLLSSSVKYSDTATMLSKYLRVLDTTAHWAPKLPYLLSFTESDPVWVAASSNYWTKMQSDTRYLQSFTETDPLSVHITDSASMLSKYLRKQDTTGRWAFKANYLLQELDPISIHVSDSANMLSPYIRAAQALTIYYPLTNPAGYITSAAITGKVNVSDTTSMLSPYIRSVVAAASIALKVNISDTANMLSPYIRALNASQTYYPLVGNPSSFLTSASIIGKVNVSDTAAMLTPYAKAALVGVSLALKNNISDTAVMLSPYLRRIDTTGMLSGYLRKIDTAFMMSGYLRKIDTSAMLTNYVRKVSIKRIETYLGTTDGSGNYTVTYGTAYAATPDVQPQLQTSTTQQQVRITASSTTGFTVNATNRSTVTLLTVDVLLGATAPLTGVQVGVLVTSR